MTGRRVSLKVIVVVLLFALVVVPAVAGWSAEIPDSTHPSQAKWSETPDYHNKNSGYIR